MTRDQVLQALRDAARNVQYAIDAGERLGMFDAPSMHNLEQAIVDVRFALSRSDVFAPSNLIEQAVPCRATSRSSHLRLVERFPQSLDDDHLS